MSQGILSKVKSRLRELLFWVLDKEVWLVYSIKEGKYKLEVKMVKKKSKDLWKKDWTEHFYNRRVWGAVAGGLCLLFGALGWTEVSVVSGSVAGVLGGWSYMKPK